MLFDALHDLGAALPESQRPSPGALANIVAGLVYYAENGTLEPPKVEEPPTPAAQAEQAAENQRVAELESEVNRLQQEAAAREAGPSPVLTGQNPAPAQPEGNQPPAQPEAGQPANPDAVIPPPSA